MRSPKHCEANKLLVNQSDFCLRASVCHNTSDQSKRMITPFVTYRIHQVAHVHICTNVTNSFNLQIVLKCSALIMQISVFDQTKVGTKHKSSSKLNLNFNEKSTACLLQPSCIIFLCHQRVLFTVLSGYMYYICGISLYN